MKDLITVIDHGDVAAKAAIHLSELKTDITRAQNQKVLRDLQQIHDAGVGKVPDLIEPFDHWDGRTGPRIDKDPITLQLLSIDVDFVWADEATFPAIKTDVFCAFLEFVFQVGSPIIHVPIFPRYDLGDVDPRPARMYAPFRAVSSIVRHLRRGDHGLGRRASGVDAGAPKMISFDQCDFPVSVRHVVTQWISRLPRADYDRVKLGHREFSFWAFFAAARNVGFRHKADIPRRAIDVPFWG